MVRSPYHLLLASESDEIRNQIVENLSGQESIIVTSLAETSGTAIQEALQAQTYDLILLGIEPGETEYIEVIPHIKSNPRTQMIPVVVVSTELGGDVINRYIADGADDYLLSPIDARVLLTRIEVSIDRTRIQYDNIHSFLDSSEMARQALSPALIGPSATDALGNVDEYLQRTLTEIKTMNNADAGVVFYREGDKLRYVVLQIDSLGLAVGGTTNVPITYPLLDMYNSLTQSPNFNHIATAAALSGETINTPKIYSTRGFDFSEIKAIDESLNYKTVSCLAVPLKDHRGSVIAVIQIMNARDTHGHIIPFDRSRQIVTTSLCAHVATILSNRLLIHHQMMMSKVENDIQIGRQIQHAFLPSKFPEIEGWEIASYFKAAREVAGDFFDAFVMPSNRVGILIADVCDKGVGAALFMSLMRSLFRAYAMQHYTVDWLSLKEIPLRKAFNTSTRHAMPSTGLVALENAVKLTNNYVATNHADLNMFATTFFAVLDPASGSLLYINGGHCPPMVLDSEGNIKARIDQTGPAVGMFADAEFEIGEITLEHGDSLFLFTDGVTDARNPAGKMFKEAGIKSQLTPAFSSMHELLGRMENSLENFIADAAQFDDITMLGVRRAPAAAAAE